MEANPVGRPPLQPTQEERDLVEAMSGHGVPQEQIAALIRGGIDDNTLVKHFKAELLAGKAKANAQIGSTLFDKAMSGDTAALIFWAKTQMRWKETKVQEIREEPTLTPEQRKAKIRELMEELNIYDD